MDATEANPRPSLERITIDVLNEFFQTDPKACQELIDHRVKCNAALADHDTIVVAVPKKDQFEVGLVGVLNGIMERATGKRIATMMDGQTLVGFCEYQKKKP